VPTNRRVDDSFVSSKGAKDHGQVRPADGPGGQLSGERIVGTPTFGQDEEAGRALVEAVDDARTASPAHAGDPGNVSQYRSSERPSAIARTGVHDHPGRLVDDEQVLVLVHDDQIPRLRRQLVRGGWWHHHLDDLAAPKSMSGLSDVTVHLDQAVHDEGLKPCT
jgi:hypothetical protein